MSQPSFSSPLDEFKTIIDKIPLVSPAKRNGLFVKFLPIETSNMDQQEVGVLIEDCYNGQGIMHASHRPAWYTLRSHYQHIVIETMSMWPGYKTLPEDLKRLKLPLGSCSLEEIARSIGKQYMDFFARLENSVLNSDLTSGIDPSLIGSIARWRMGKGGYYQKGMIRLLAIRHIGLNIFHADMRVFTESKFAENPLDYMDNHTGFDIFTRGLPPLPGHLKYHGHSKK